MNPQLKKQLDDNIKLCDDNHCYTCTLFTKRYLCSFI